MNNLARKTRILAALLRDTRRLKKLPRIAMALLRDPRRIARVLDEEDDKQNYVIRVYGLKSGLPTLDPLDLFPCFEETVDPYSFLEGTSPAMDIALLTALARRFPQCRYLEIGTWRGESIANVSAVAETCISVSLSDDELRTLGLTDDFLQTSRFFSNGKPNITHIGHDSQTFDFSPFHKSIDLVFIDGDHSYECVRRDTQNAFELLRDRGAVIVWYDYGFTPETVRWSVLAGILDGTPSDLRSQLYHVANTMCAICVAGDFLATVPPNPRVPGARFSVHIKGTRINPPNRPAQ